MQPVPYLFFDGTCEEALRAYQRVFDAPEPTIMRTAEAPADYQGDGNPDAVMHAALKVGDGWIWASDYKGTPPMAGACVCVSMPDAPSSKRVFDQLAEGGEVEMPFEPTFWSPGFGGCTDRWGTRWLVDTDTPQEAESAPREAEAVA